MVRPEAILVHAPAPRADCLPHHRCGNDSGCIIAPSSRRTNPEANARPKRADVGTKTSVPMTRSASGSRDRASDSVKGSFVITRPQAGCV